jgi:hypothetical protein
MPSFIPDLNKDFESKTIEKTCGINLYQISKEINLKFKININITNYFNPYKKNFSLTIRQEPFI